MILYHATEKFSIQFLLIFLMFLTLSELTETKLYAIMLSDYMKGGAG